VEEDRKVRLKSSTTTLGGGGKGEQGRLVMCGAGLAGETVWTGRSLHTGANLIRRDGGASISKRRYVL